MSGHYPAQLNYAIKDTHVVVTAMVDQKIENLLDVRLPLVFKHKGFNMGICFDFVQVSRAHWIWPLATTQLEHICSVIVFHM